MAKCVNRNGQHLAERSLDVRCDSLDVRCHVLQVRCDAVELDVEAAEAVEDRIVLLDRLQLRGALAFGVRSLAARLCTGCKVLTASGRWRKKNLQPDLQDVDEPADLVNDLGARRAELVRTDDLQGNMSVHAKRARFCCWPMTVESYAVSEAE